MEVRVRHIVIFARDNSSWHPLKVILVQAENEFSAGTNRSPYMQDIIDLYRNNGIVIRKSCLRTYSPPMN